MEPIAVLLILAIVAWIFVMPIVAVIKAGEARREVESMVAKVRDLEVRARAQEQELRKLRGQTALPGLEPVLGDEETSAAPAKRDRWGFDEDDEPIPGDFDFATPPPAPAPPALPQMSADEVTMGMPPPPPPLRADVDTAPPETTAEPVVPPTAPAVPAFSLEQFMGVKLFAWLGGVALFFGVIFFVKYAFERNLIPPAVRVALGFIAGGGLLAAGLIVHRKQAYRVLAQSFCATGVLILYGVSFAAHAVYDFPAFGPWITFGLMGLITAAAILIAVRLDALVVAVLGMIGGFVAPLLFHGVQDNTLALFSYVALLDLGLLAATRGGHWRWLAPAAALGTMVLMLRWHDQFFQSGRYFAGSLTLVPIGILLGLLALFTAAAWWRRKSSDSGFAVAAAAGGMVMVAMAFAFDCLAYQTIAQRAYLLYGFVLFINLAGICLAVWQSRIAPAQKVLTALSFIHILAWTHFRLRPELLTSALVVYLVFGAMHAILPVVLRRRQMNGGSGQEVQAGAWMPVVSLALVLALVNSLPGVSWLIWPFVLVLDFLVMVLAALTGGFLVVCGALVLTLVVAAAWLLGAPAALPALAPFLMVIVLFAAVFAVAGSLLPKWGRRLMMDDSEPNALQAQALEMLPALSGALPFGLLILAVLRLPVANPTPIFGVALLLGVLLLGLSLLGRQPVLALAALLGTLAVEAVWHGARFSAASPWIPLWWYVGFYVLFLVFPFLFNNRTRDAIAPWMASALSGVGHFLLVHQLVRHAFPNDKMGLLPFAFALPSLLALVVVLRMLPAAVQARQSQLAWFGGVALLFITLIFPIQFDRQWLTVSWALEGAMLLWLFRRVPHDGLRITGLALLGIAFVRLALNPAVITAYPRGGTAIINWHLYAYGIGALSMFLGGHWLTDAGRRIGNWEVDIKAVLNGFCGVLLFLLLNIEIADYFTVAGERFIAFRFGGNFARDMTYSIAWGVFSLGLLVLGIVRREKGARYAAICLLVATLVKLFLHDLSQIDNIFRIGALIGVAVIAFIASFLYQRFFASANHP